MLFYVRDRGNISAKKPTDVNHKQNSVANAAAHTKQNVVVENRVESSYSALSKKDTLMTSAPKENPSKTIPLESVSDGVAIGSPDTKRGPQSELPSVGPTAENLAKCPSATPNSVSHHAGPRSTPDPQSEPPSVIRTTENLSVNPASHAETRLTTEALGAALLSGDHTPNFDCNNRLDSTPDINTNKVDKSQSEPAPCPHPSNGPCTVSKELCSIVGSNSELVTTPLLFIPFCLAFSHFATFSCKGIGLFTKLNNFSSIEFDSSST